MAVFWNEKAEEVENVIKRGSKIQIVNGRLKPNQNGERELHVDYSTYVALFEAPKVMSKIANITGNIEEVNVQGEVATTPVSKEVKTSKGELVKLTSFDLADETGQIRVTAWRDHSEFASELSMGEKIVIENVFAKIGYSGNVELSTRAASVITRL